MAILVKLVGMQIMVLLGCVCCFVFMIFLPKFQINIMDKCLFQGIIDICVGSFSQSGNERVKLQQKGVDGINKASKKRGIELNVEKGMFVHKICRSRYINTDGDLNAIKKVKTDTGSIPIVSCRTVSLRSKSSRGYKYKTHCLLCETIAVNEKEEKLEGVFQVRSTDWQTEIENTCEKRLIFFVNGDIK